MNEAFVTQSIARHLVGLRWTLHSVARPEIGSGVTLRPDPDDFGRRPKNKGSVVIDIIAARNGQWLFLENKDRFSKSDLDKLIRVRDGGDYSQDLDTLTGNAQPVDLLFGLGMPRTPLTGQRCLEHSQDLDVFLGVEESGACVELGGARPAL